MLSPSQYNAKFQIELIFNKSWNGTAFSLHGVCIISINHIYHFQLNKEFISKSVKWDTIESSACGMCLPQTGCMSLEI